MGDIINIDIIIAIVIVGTIILGLRYIKPYMKKRGKTIYLEVELALRLTGKLYKHEQIKEIISLTVEVVEIMKDLTCFEDEVKKSLGVASLTNKILKQLSIKLDEETLRLIVNIVEQYI